MGVSRGWASIFCGFFLTFCRPGWHRSCFLGGRGVPMRRRALDVLLLTLLAATFSSERSYAQQSVSFSLGGFVPHGESARISSTNGAGDVLVNNLDFLAFDFS